MTISCKKEIKETPSKKIISIEKDTLKSTSKIDTIHWNNELCTFTSSFISSEYKKSELQNTLKLINYSVDFFVDLYPIFKIDDNIVTIKTLKDDYSLRRKEIEELTIIDDNYWASIKTLKLEKLKSNFEIKQLAYNAYYHDISLLKKSNYDKKANQYVDALVSNDSLKMVTAWRNLIDEQKLKNGNPNYLESKFQNRLQSSNCLEYAKMDLFSFGWWNNCLGRDNKKYSILEEYKLQESFKKVFVKTEEVCDEP